MHQQLQLKIMLAAHCKNLHIFMHIGLLPFKYTILRNLLTSTAQFDFIFSITWIICLFISETIDIAWPVWFGGYPGKHIHKSQLYLSVIYVQMVLEEWELPELRADVVGGQSWDRFIPNGSLLIEMVKHYCWVWICLLLMCLSNLFFNIISHFTSAITYDKLDNYRLVPITSSTPYSLF
jgi:hypothetical protein